LVTSHTVLHDIKQDSAKHYFIFLLVLFKCTAVNTGLFEMNVGVLTTCHTQYTNYDDYVCRITKGAHIEHL